MFITVEGIDGSGKSSLVTRLAAWLQSIGMNVVQTKEPGGTPLADRIRSVFKESFSETFHGDTEILLVCATRVQHVNEVVLPALASGHVVVSDRFSDSTYAYQIPRGTPEDDIKRLNAFATKGLAPDVTILIDLPVDIAFRRSERRGDMDRLESDREYQEAIRTAYLTLAAANPDRIRTIDGSKTPDQVFEQAREIIERSIDRE